MIFWIELMGARGFRWDGAAGLLINTRKQDQAVQTFHRPSFGGEPQGQPIQQFRVAGRVAARAEVALGANQARAKMVGPHAVGHDAGGQWIVRAGDGASQLEAAAAFLKWTPAGAGQHLEELARHTLSWFQWIAASKDHGRDRLGPIFNNQGMLALRFVRDQPAFEFCLQVGQRHAIRIIEIKMHIEFSD